MTTDERRRSSARESIVVRTDTELIAAVRSRNRDWGSRRANTERSRGRSGVFIVRHTWSSERLEDISIMMVLAVELHPFL